MTDFGSVSRDAVNLWGMDTREENGVTIYMATMHCTKCVAPVEFSGPSAMVLAANMVFWSQSLGQVCEKCYERKRCTRVS